MKRSKLDHLHATLDYLQEAIVFHDLDTSIIFANKAAAKFLNLDQETLQTKNLYNEEWKLVNEDGDELELSKYPIKILIDTQKSFQNYIIGKQYNDHTLWLNVNGEIAYKDDQVDYYIITFSDISPIKNANKELEFYKILTDYADTGITVADPSKKNMPLIFANKMFEKLTGYKKEEVYGKNCKFLQGDLKDQDGTKVIRNAIKNHKSCEVELKNFTKTGELFYNLLNLTPLFDKNGNLEYYIGIQHNITKLKNLQHQFQKLLDQQDNLILLTDGETIKFANKKFCNFMGYETLELFKQSYKCVCELFIENERFFSLKKKDPATNWIKEIQKLPEQKQIVSMMGYDFHIYAFNVSISSFDSDLQIVSFTDISNTMEEYIKLEEKTLKDKLTGAFNREFFEQNIQRLKDEYIKEDSFLALAVIDIDYFKAVNDTFGHDAGDKFLQEFVNIIQQYSRVNDILIRWGGEEFILILKVESQKGLYKALEHLRSIVSLQNFSIVGTKTCSIGASIYTDNEDIMETFKRADTAVYNAKNNGRNKVEIL